MHDFENGAQLAVASLQAPLLTAGAAAVAFPPPHLFHPTCLPGPAAVFNFQREPRRRRPSSLSASAAAEGAATAAAAASPAPPPRAGGATSAKAARKAGSADRGAAKRASPAPASTEHKSGRRGGKAAR